MYAAVQQFQSHRHRSSMTILPLPSVPYVSPATACLARSSPPPPATAVHILRGLKLAMTCRLNDAQLLLLHPHHHLGALGAGERNVGAAFTGRCWDTLLLFLPYPK